MVSSWRSAQTLGEQRPQYIAGGGGDGGGGDGGGGGGDVGGGRLTERWEETEGARTLTGYAPEIR